jgi:hypothetical protein
MKRTSLLLFLASSFQLLASFPAQAATLSPGDLIKGPNATVYYYGQNGKRYVFPTPNTYFTWYSDFSGVKTLTASELADLPLGGNATYRPGVKLVKITTDPRVYAVASHGTLRWIETETAARTLYGADWNKKVDDVPDAFFISYSMGPSIKNASDFAPTATTDAASSINIDKQLSGEPPTATPAPVTPAPTSTTPVVPVVPIAPVATSTSPLTLTVSKATVQPSDVETLTSNYTGGLLVSKTELFFDGSLVTACTSQSCSGDALVPRSGTKTSYVVETHVTLANSTVLTQSMTINVQKDGNALVRLVPAQMVIQSNQNVGMTAYADSSLNVSRIDLFVDGTDIHACSGTGLTCSWSVVLTGGEGATHPVYATVQDSLGRTYTSKTLYIMNSTKDVPAVTVTPAKTTIYAGESVDVTASASSNVGVTSIDVLKDGAILKHCSSSAPCTVTTGPWTLGSVLTFSGSAVDAVGTTGTAMSADVVNVIAKP